MWSMLTSRVNMAFGEETERSTHQNDQQLSDPGNGKDGGCLFTAEVPDPPSALQARADDQCPTST